ncbi:proliferation marker protein Ki-67 isoform X2 [Cavia porcellus]|uniref:proliferation marker protein Ki-67 isoform X2 n=1 Tax=Cavia porcellus TaxID=10141 RepID=UPI000C877735|nr:proliferation marker protein Ki-67 isoform X2 [Cavia porcellus]
MDPPARLVTIKRNGLDGIPFPLTLSTCLFGRATECDIRIQLPVVSKQHCKIEISKQEAVLHNFSTTNPTQVNGSAVDAPIPLRHGDIITIIDRSFRYENESYQNRSKSPELPEKIREQKPARRASRASFSADPDEKDPNSKAHSSITKGNASAKSPVHVKELKQDSTTSDGSKNSAAQESLRSPSSEDSRHGSKNARDPTTGDFNEKSRVTLGDCHGEQNPFTTTQVLDNGKNESPFKKLYQSMKDEFSIKSQRHSVLQYRRKSGALTAHTAGKEESSDGSQKEAQPLVSSKARRKSSRSTHINGASSPAPGMNQAEENKSDPEPIPTPKEAVRCSTSFSQVTQVHTPVQHSPQRSSQKRKSEDLHATDRQELANLGKNEEVSLKRRRVSFGGHLRPELFDENLPPNTPLKRGETPIKRKSLGTHTPTVLKKVIKEQPQASEKEEPSEICLEVKAQNACLDEVAPSPRVTPPRTNDQRRRSHRASTASADGKSPHEPDIPKKAGRKSGHLPSKRASISRSQHDILQMISSKRRSGASEANLIVAKSWADVVKLGVKQMQTKVVKHAPSRQMHRRQRKPNTPKKPSDSVHNQFSTGHANSPCTIVIRKAQIEKVNVPPRPYRMLNNFVLNQKMDYNEDLSGLTEMFKTPVKEKPQTMSTCSTMLSNSENLPGKKSKVISLEEESLPIPSINLGENVYCSAQNAAKESSDKYFASPVLRKKCIKEDEKIVKTTRNIYKITNFEIKTPDSVTEPLKTVCSTNKLRRSVEFTKMQMQPTESKSEETEAGIIETITEKSLRKTPREKEKERGMKDSEISLETFKENVESNENSGKITSRRSRSRERTSKSGGKKHESTGDKTGLKRIKREKSTQNILDTQIPLQKTDCAKESTNEAGTVTIIPCKSSQPKPVDSPTNRKRQLKTTLGKMDVKEEEVPSWRKVSQISEEYIHIVDYDKSMEVFQETPKQKLDSAIYTTGMKRWPRTKNTQPLEDLVGIKELLQTQECIDESVSEYKTKGPCSVPHTAAMDTPRRRKTLPNTPRSKVDVKEDKAIHTQKATEDEDKGIKAFKEPTQQTPDLATSTSDSKRLPRTPKAKAQSVENLTGSQEVFQTPSHVKDSMIEQQTPKTPHGSSQSGLVDISATSKRCSKMKVEKRDGKEELPTLRKLTQSPDKAMHTPTAPVEEKKVIRASMRTPKQKLDMTGNSAELKRPAQTSKTKTQPVEDLAGFQELFQTPSHAKDSVTEQETPQTSLRSSQPGPMDTSVTSKRRSVISLGKTDGKEEHSTPRKLTQSPHKAMHTPTAPVEEKKVIRASMRTPKQKLDMTGNSAELKRPARTSKTKTQPVEDLAGFQELFQTPSHAKDSVTEQETPQTSLSSSQLGPMDTSVTSKRRSMISLGKADGKEEHSTPRKLTQSSHKAMHTPTAPVEEKKVIRASMRTPKQKLDMTGKSAELKRLARTSKTKTQPVEDLAGFQELFQTPSHAKDSVTEQETPQTPLSSSQLGPMDTSVTSKRRSVISLRKTDGTGEHSTPRKLTQSPDKAMHTPTAPVEEKQVISASMRTPKQKLDMTGNSAELKRPARTSKTKTQPVEDLAGLQELFQTPSHVKDSVTEQETPEILHRSSQSGPVDISAVSTRHSKISLGEMDEKQELSIPRKLTQSPVRTMHTPTVTIQKKHIRASMQTPKQRLDLTENSSELKRPVRTPKTKVQALEDLAGFQELFQAPGHSKNQVTAEETPRTPFLSPQPAPVGTLTTSRTRSKISIGKVDMKEGLSSHNKLTQSPGKAMHAPLIPVQEKGIRTSTETQKQKLDQTENLVGHQRGLQRPKTKVQPQEDLAGFQELLQTSGHAEDLVTSEKTTEVLYRSPQPGSVDTSSSKRCHKTNLGKVDVKELSVVRELTQMSEKTMYTPTVKVDDGDKSICYGDSLNPVTNESGRRQQRTTKAKTQFLENLTGFQELFQTLGDAKDPVTTDENTKMPYISPHPGLRRTSSTLNKHPRTSVGTVDMKEVLSAPKILTQSPGKALHIPLVSVQEEKSIRASTGTAKQKLNPRENLNGPKRQPQTPKQKACVLEDLTGFQELFRTPGHANDPTTPDETTKKSTPATSKGHPETSLEKDRKEVPAMRKCTQTGKAMHTSKVLEGADKVFKDFVEQTLITATKSNKRQSRKYKEEVPVIEDLAGLQELFQTPDHAKDPKSVGKTTKVPCISVQTESVGTPTRVVRQSTSLGGKIVKEHLAVLNLTQISEKIADKHEEPTDDKQCETFKKSTKRKMDPAECVTGIKRLRGESKKNSQSLEDLTGFKELFQTPAHIEESVSDEQTTKTPCISQLESVNTPRRKKGLPSTPRGKRDMKEKQIICTRNTADDDDKGIKAFKESAKQTLNLAANVSGSRRWPRTPKLKAQVLEDLTAFQELFQTPDYAKDSIITDNTTKMPSTPTDPMYTPTTSKRSSKTSQGKKEPSSLRRGMQSPGQAMHTPSVPFQEQQRIRPSTEMPKQKLNPRENLSGFEIQPQTPKEEAHVLEDLTGFQELFQTPGHAKDPVTENLTGLRRQPRTRKAKAQPLEDLSGLQELFQTPGHCSSNLLTEDETSKMPYRFPQSPPMDTSAALKRHSKISLGKEEHSSFGKLTQSPVKTMHIPLVPVQEQKGIRASTGTSKQKLALTENLVGLKRCPKAQPLEDLAGLQELFQTPGNAKHPENAVKTPYSSQSTPVDTLKTSKRGPKTSIGKVGVKAELSLVREQTLRETMHAHKEGIDDEDNQVLKESAKRKLDPAENENGTKRLRRAPKEKTQTLEDLGELQELFQMPGHTEESMSDEKAITRPYKSPPSVRTPVNTKRGLSTRLRKVNMKEDCSAMRKATQTSRTITYTSKVLEDDDKGIKHLKEPEKQTMEHAVGIRSSRRWPRAAKEKAQPLQDLTGSRELIQISGHTEESVGGEKTTKMPCKSQVPGDSSETSKRRPRTRFGKVDMTEELSAQRKQTGSSVETLNTHKEPTSGSKSIKEFKESAKQKLDPAENVTGIKRLRRAPKEKTQTLEDMGGLQESFQMPGHTEESMSDEKAIIMPYKSPPSAPVRTPVNTKRGLSTRLRKVNVKEDFSAMQKATRTSRTITYTSKVLEDDDKGIKHLKEPEKQTMEHAIGIRSSRRWPRAAKEKAQPLQDLTGSRELIQISGHTEESVGGEKTTKMPCKSPQVPGDCSETSKRRPRTRFGKVDVTEELSAQRKQTGSSVETLNTHNEPTNSSKNIKEFTESAKQKLNPAENVTGTKRLRGSLKGKTQELEDMADSKELIQKSADTEESVRNEKTTETLCKYSQLEPVDVPASTKRQLRTRLGNVNVKEGLSVFEKPTRVSRATSHISKMPEGDDKDIKTFKESSEQTLGTAISITSSRRYLRASKAKSKVENLPSPKEISQTLDHIEEQINDVHNLKSTLQQISDNVKPLKTFRRAFRVPKEKSIEDVVDTKVPVASQNGMSLRTRHQNKTEANQQRLEIPTSEKAKLKRHEKKSMKTSEETEQQNPDDEAGKPTSKGKVSGNRICLRAGRRNKNSQLQTAEKDGKEQSMDIPVKNQEKEVTKNPDTVSLRSRRAKIQPKGNTSESDSAQQITRGTKRCAENPKKDRDIVDTKKIRTRSHRNIENI